MMYLYFTYLGAIMILGSSYEFDKSHNKDIMERPSDNIELPQVGDIFYLT